MSLPLLKQKLLFPQEIEVWYVLPAIRKAFATSLITAGKPQKEIAAMMGLTEAAISQYKKDKRAHELQEIKAEVEKSVPRILQDSQQLFPEMMRINEYIKSSGLFCKLHRSKSYTPEGCEKVCSYGGLHG